MLHDMQRQLILGFLVALVIASVSSAARIDVTQAEAGEMLFLKRGDLLVISLPSNRTTGYCWRVTSSERGVLKQEGKVLYERSDGGMVRLGAGGDEVWRFHATVAGRTTLTFSYARPWERDVPPVRVVAWSVKVR